MGQSIKIFIKSEIKWLVIIAILFTSIINPLTISQVGASVPSGNINPWDVIGNETRAYQAMNMLELCLDDEWISTSKDADGPLPGLSQTTEVGAKPFFFRDDHEVDCDTEDDMEKVLEALGLNSLKLQEIMFKDDSGNTADCGDNKCPFGLNNNPSLTSATADLINKLWSHLKEDSDIEVRPGFTAPQPEHDMYFWNAVMRADSGAGCTGKFTNDEQEYNGEEESYRMNGDGNYYFAPLSNNEKISKLADNPDVSSWLEGEGAYEYAILNSTPKDHTIESLTPAYSGSLGADTRCSNIVDFVGNKEKWIAIMDIPIVKDFIEKCNSPGGSCAAASEPETDTTDGSGTIEPNCENTSGITGWIICPVIDGAFAIMRVVEGAVAGQLKFTLDDIGGGASGVSSDQIKQGHNSLLLIANFMFAVGILWIVISQAITGGAGGGFFGAYEAKKILPKLIAGIIVANFSWELVNLLLIITNAIGDSIKSIMLSPFPGSTNMTITLNDGSDLLLVGLGVGLGIGLAIFGFFAVSPILIMVLIAILSAIIFSVLRKGMIIVLVTFAPIMLALSPFMPNIFKRYYKLLLNVIIFYIVVMVSVAACTIIGFITFGAGGGNNQATSIGESLTKLLGIAFYFGWMFPVLAFAKNNFDVVGKVGGSLQSMGNKAGRQFGQNRLAGNQRRINRETKKQREIGLKKTNAQRRQTGIITRRFDRGRKGQEAYDQEYESSLQSMGVNAGNANLAQKTKARALAEKAKSKAIAKEGLSQKPLNTLRDRTVRGRFNQEDRRAKGAYEAKVAIGGIEEAYKDAEAESEIVFDGMDKSSAQKEAFRIATDFDGHDKYQRRAAIKKLVQLKATNELGRVMDTHMNSTEGSQEWNNLLASDMFTTIKAHDASLTLPYNPGEEQQAQVTAYSGFNSGNLLTMQGEASWARFGESM